MKNTKNLNSPIAIILISIAILNKMVLISYGFLPVLIFFIMLGVDMYFIKQKGFYFSNAINFQSLLTCKITLEWHGSDYTNFCQEVLWCPLRVPALP